MRMFPEGDADAANDDGTSPEYKEFRECEDHLRMLANDECLGRCIADHGTLAKAALYIGFLLNEIAANTFQ